MWKQVNCLINCEASNCVSNISQNFNQIGTRDSITAALQTSTGSHLFVTRTFVGNELSVFSPVTDGDVRRVLSKMPSKPSPLDAVPITLLQSCADVFVLIIVRLANLSFTEGHFPARYTKAQVMPLLKKSGLDSLLPSNY